MQRFEWKKLFGNKAFWGMLLTCFFLNGVFLLWEMGRYDEETRCFPRDITKVYEEIEEIPREEKAEWLLKEAEMELEAEVPNHARRIALEEVASYMQETLDYESYLVGIEERANQIAHSSLFSDADVFSKRNAVQTPKQYEHLHGLILEPENSQGIVTATECGMTDLFLIAIVILFSYFVICTEREEGTMAFVRCTINGGKRLGGVKLFTVLIGTTLSTLILYGTNLLLAGAKYGLGDLSRWMQSVDGYLSSPWKISVGVYLVWFFIGKLLVTAILSALVVWVLLKGRSILESSLILIAIIVIEYVLYSQIDSLSWLSILKQCNLFYLLDTKRFLESYYTVNLFGYPVSSLSVCSVFGAFVLLCFGVQSVRCYEKVSQMEYTMKKRGWKMPTVLKGGYKSLWRYEAKKILIVHKAGFLFLLFLILLTGIYANKVEYFGENEIYYRHYIRQVEGKMTDEKLKFLEEEGVRIEMMENVNAQENCRNGYERVCAQAERIGGEGIFLDEVAFERILDRNEFVKQCGMLLIVFVLAFYPVFIDERLSRMDTIWSSIPNGRKKIVGHKWLVLVISVVTVCILSNVIVIWHETKLLDITNLNVPIRYLAGYEAWGRMTVMVYMAGRCAVQILFGILAAMVTWGFSKKAKNATTVLLLVGGVVTVGYIVGSLMYLR